MTQPTTENSHRFHIPVLGTGYTVDTPLKVAKYGISSVMSIVDDKMIEEVRRYHCLKSGIKYVPIPEGEEDHRARRITAYLDLLDMLVKKQVEEIRKMPFGEKNDLALCFEMLPDCPLRAEYLHMLATPAGAVRNDLEASLRNRVEAGSLDVNIMTKLDRQSWIGGKQVDAWYSDATAALRGYAKSTVESSIVFSAGMNPRLFASMSDYPDFFADETGRLKKKIILKVSDYRSAFIQGTLLAKKGLWTSEYRIESGLNCGGHAFASKGMLLGPILDEFLVKRSELFDKLHASYIEGTREAGRNPGQVDIRITVQGGVGTSAESSFLQTYYNVGRVGWGTPFLLVPEAVNLDADHMRRLCEAGPGEVFLSEASPLGIPFWNLRTSDSELARERRVREGRPGVPCKKKFLAFNTEFSEEPICTASRTYQKLKIDELAAAILPENTKTRLKEGLLAKVCLCMDLAATVTKGIGVDPKGTTAITAGPNIVNFSKIVSLSDMVSHIYGRINLITAKSKPHVFLRELEIYIDYVRKEMQDEILEVARKGEKYFGEVRRNLLSGIEYYRELSEKFVRKERDDFLAGLESLKNDLLALMPDRAL